jgi:hypothetical protein
VGKKHPWITGWLLGGKLPPDIDSFRPTNAMLSFRRCASIKSKDGIATAASLSGSALRYWRKRYTSWDWIADWILSGQEAPVRVKVATRGTIERMTACCDYEGHCKDHGGKLGSKYYLWLYNQVTVKDLQWSNSRKYQWSVAAELALASLVQGGLAVWQVRPISAAAGRRTGDCVLVPIEAPDDPDETSDRSDAPVP